MNRKAIAVEASGTILVADRTEDYGWSGRIVRIDPANRGTQSVVTELPFAPGAIAVDPAGTIWVASRESGSRFMGCIRTDHLLPGPTRNSFEIGKSRVASRSMAMERRWWHTRAEYDAYVVRFDPADGEQGDDRGTAGDAVFAGHGERDLHLFVDANRQAPGRHRRPPDRIDPVTGVQTLSHGSSPRAALRLPICLNSDVALAPDGRSCCCAR